MSCSKPPGLPIERAVPVLVHLETKGASEEIRIRIQSGFFPRMATRYQEWQQEHAKNEATKDFPEWILELGHRQLDRMQGPRESKNDFQRFLSLAELHYDNIGYWLMRDGNFVVVARARRL